MSVCICACKRNGGKKEERKSKDTAENDDMKDRERKSVNAFHLFFVYPNVDRVSVCGVCLYVIILHLNWKLNHK